MNTSQSEVGLWYIYIDWVFQSYKDFGGSWVLVAGGGGLEVGEGHKMSETSNCRGKF